MELLKDRPIHTAKKRKRETELAMIETTAGQWGMPITSPAISSQIIRIRHNRSKQWYLNQLPPKLKISNNEVHKL
jgi:hypothetical protein